VAKLPLNAMVLGSIQVDPALISLTGDKASSRIQVAKVGSWPHSKKLKGGFSITGEMLEAMRANAGTNELSIDYNHLSLRAENPDQGVAAGWMTQLELNDAKTELFATANWTPKAAQHIKDGEYRYISPTFVPKSIDLTTGEEIGAELLCAALTNLPFLKGMAPVELSELERLGMVHLVGSDTFSLDEKKSRIYDAVSKRFRNDSEYAYAYDLFDDHVIVKRGVRYFKLTYSFDSNGEVKLAETLVEVLPAGYAEIAASLNREDPPIMVNDNEVTLVSLQTQLTSLQGIVNGLQTDNQAKDTEIANLKTQLATTAVEATVDGLIREGKVKKDDKQHYVALGVSNKTLFDSITAGLSPVVALRTEHGSGDGKKSSSTSKPDVGDLSDTSDSVILSEENPDRVIALVHERVKQHVATNKVKTSEALNAVLGDNPDLEKHYRSAFVIAGSPGMAQ
jgi:hypothetical protein